MPTITHQPPSNLTKVEGNNVSLPCYATGFPKPVITWYKDGEKLEEDYYSADTGTLTFSNIQFADRGLYRCEARNFVGSESATVKIVVEGKGIATSVSRQKKLL